MSLDDEDVTSDELRRSERVRLRASSSSEASADAAMPAKETARPRADDKENDEPAAESPEERRRAAASFKARRRRRTVDARCLLEDDAPPQPPPRVALNAWSDDENVKGAEDETVELKANAEAETVEIGADPVDSYNLSVGDLNADGWADIVYAVSEGSNYTVINRFDRLSGE